MVRLLELPTAREASMTGTARLSAVAPEAVLDPLLGRPGVDEGGVTSSSSRRLPGDVSAGATAAIDGDPSTHWSPGFLAQDAEWARYRTAEPVTFDHLDLTVVADGRHTVPTSLWIEVDGERAAVVDVPPIDDVDEPDATTDVRVDLPAEVTGTDVRIGIASGSVVMRMGDVFGPPVNMAARLTGVARRNRVITDRTTAERLPEDRFEWRTLPPRPLRGFGIIEPVTVRRL